MNKETDYQWSWPWPEDAYEVMPSKPRPTNEQVREMMA